MISDLDDKLRDVYWGYIYMDKDGDFSHKYRTKINKFIDDVNILKEALFTSGVVNFLPRGLIPHQGVISWYRKDDALCLYGMITRKNTSFGDSKKLYYEFEKLAKKLNVDTIETLTIPRPKKYLTEDIMLRLGWELVKKGSKHTMATYRKNISIEKE